MKNALLQLAEEAAFHVQNGAVNIILSDKNVDAERLAMPALAALGAVHHHLIKKGLRLKCSLIVETSQCWTSHQAACLLAYGAQAVVPYLAFESIRHWFETDKTQQLIQSSKGSALSIIGDAKDGGTSSPLLYDVRSAQADYAAALESGLLKIISKMGVSKLTSYIGAQIFDCIGLSKEIIDLCFPGTYSAVGGLTFDDLQMELTVNHQKAFVQHGSSLCEEGTYKSKRAGEFHRNNPELVKSLHTAVKLRDHGATDETRKEQYLEYSSLVSKQPISTLRELLEIKSDRAPVPVSEVESVESIVKKFCTGGMSLGALSKEAHEALAVAMNRLGARSNCGEGGEDSIRYYPIDVSADGTSKDFPALRNLRPGDFAGSKIRQVASARFGVTPQYLATAEQLEIKIAQGAKPGEGGQLPAHKVSAYIARLRNTKSGISLISPPPHHDIYSIEDLAQLIYDLRQVNPRAMISVKLVSENGIGPVALGCAKAGADIVHIAGHEGGTGAAPIGSIKHAGMPWELGLSEAHRFLTEQGLRDKVVVRVDGGLRCGEDVVKAAIMGADEFAFGTIALIAQGCIMARVCHTNNCPTGIATQMEKLRQRFNGDPSSVVAFFEFVAEEVRYLLASLGYHSLSEIRGEIALLQERHDASLEKCSHVNLSSLLQPIVSPEPLELQSEASQFCDLNELILHDKAIVSAIHENGNFMKAYHITNTDRAVGANLSGLIATVHGDKRFDGQIVLNFEGTAGQSFGAFNSQNVLLILKGEANDYVAKGMHGGEIVVRRPHDLERQDEVVLVGNTCLYGATGGRLFVAGSAGERFGVRNSAATAVVEGVGDHGCEYMTGGYVLVIGKTGRNFAAGMTGGLAFVLDEDEEFLSRVNLDCDKELYRLSHASEEVVLALLEDHVRLTGSLKARHILENWHDYRGKFVQVVPPAERGLALPDTQFVEDALCVRHIS